MVSIPNGLPTLLPREKENTMPYDVFSRFNPKRASYTSSTLDHLKRAAEKTQFQSQTGFLHFFHLLQKYSNGFHQVQRFNPKRASYTSSTAYCLAQLWKRHQLASCEARYSEESFLGLIGFESEHPQKLPLL